MMAQHLMQLGDEATGKLGGITQQFDSSSEKLKRHGEALDRAADSARTTLVFSSKTCRVQKKRLAALPSSSDRSVLEPPKKRAASKSR